MRCLIFSIDTSHELAKAFDLAAGYGGNLEDGSGVGTIRARVTA